MNDQEFELVFRTHFNFLRNTAYSIVHDLDTAGDITQQVFLNIWQNKEKLQLITNIKSYLTRSVINASINHAKSKKRLHYPEDIETFEISDSETIDTDREQLIEKGVKEAVAKLSPKCRLVFSLSRFSKMTNKEVAEQLDISVKAVEKNIGKALKELRIHLNPLYKSITLLFFIVFMVGILQYLLS